MAAAFIGFSLIAAVYLVTEHTMHVLGVLPYLLLLACPFMHLFMQHGHDHGVREPDGAAPSPLTTGRDVETRGDSTWKGSDHA